MVTAVPALIIKKVFKGGWRRKTVQHVIQLFTEVVPPLCELCTF